MEKYISIGNTKKAHGARGEVKVVVKDQFLEDFAAADVVFIPVQGKPVPFFVEEIREAASDLLLKLEEINSPADVLAITSKELFLREQDVLADTEAEETSTLIFAKFTGYQLIDAERGLIGEIKEVLEFPQQELASLTWQGKDLLIPLHENLIVKADKKAKTLTLRLPEGLLDL